MPTQITSAGITFNDTTTLTSANIGTAQLVNGSVTAAKLGTTEQKQICKAWVNFDGTTSPGTIRSSYNVSSVTKSGTGAYTINFATAMADANYVFVSGAMNRQNSGNSTGDVTGILVAATNTASLKTTTQLSIGYMGGGSAYDGSQIHVAIFGN
jgi:hypothetical protein